MRKKIPALHEALEGHFDAHPALWIGVILAHVDFLDEQIDRLSDAIEEQLRPFAPAIELLCTITGIQHRGAECILRYTFENLICVGAADANGELAPFSNYGDASVDIVAPGVSVLAPEPTRRTVWTDDFETPLAGRWVSSGTGNQWGRSTRWSGSPTHSLTDSPDGNSGLGVRSIVKTVAPLDLHGLGDCRLDYTIENRHADNSYIYLRAVRDEGHEEDLDYLYLDYDGRQSVSFGAVDGQPDVHLVVDFATNHFDSDGIYLDDLKVHCVDPALPALGHGLATGTSFAAPLVAAAAVLRRSLHPDESIATTKAAILGRAPTRGSAARSPATVTSTRAVRSTPIRIPRSAR
jgi:subtilisin family serine protease